MRIKYTAMALAVMSLTTILPAKGVSASNLNSNATGIIIPYVEDHDVDAVNIVDLAKAMHTEVKKVDGGVEMYLNNKRVDIYDNDVTIHINGSSVPYKTIKSKDFTTGETYDMPISQKVTKSGDGYLIPKSIIEDKIGIKCESDGIHVNDITVQPASSVDNSASYDRTANSTDFEGWRQQYGAWTYLKNGVRATGWVQDAGKWYYFGTDGNMRVGWIQDGGTWYYLNSDGSMAHDTTIDSYYLGSNGAWINGASGSTGSGSVTGISYKDLISRIDSLGFKDKEYYNASEVGTESGGYGWYWKNSDCGEVSVYDNGGFAVQLRGNDAEFHRAIYQIFNWLLPTQGKELDHILCTNLKNQTLTMDGRTVKITIVGSAVSVVITG